MKRTSGAILYAVFCAALLVNESVASTAKREATEALSRAQADFDEAQRIQAEQQDRARQLFRAAAQGFESLIASGIHNGQLEYNIGNSYLQAGDIGQAVLHYRRAQRLNPRDPLLADNLEVARRRCLTSIPPDRGDRFLRNVFFWHYGTSHTSRGRAAVGAYAGFWGLLACAFAWRRRWLTAATMAAGLLSVALAGSMAADMWSDRNAPDGVVTAMDVPVHKGPASTYQRQFEQPLQSGTEFSLRERRGDWWKIELPGGQGGWILATQAELIPPERR